MNFDTHRTFLPIGMFKRAGDCPIASASFAWVEAKKCALDAQDGDLFREPLLELELESFLVHVPLPVVVVSAHEKFLRILLDKLISAPPLVRCSNYTPLAHGATLKRCGQLALLAALIVEPTLKCVVHRYIALAYLLLCRWPNSTHQALQAAGQSFGFVLALEEAIDLLVLRTQLLNKHLFVTLKRVLVLHQVLNAILVLLEH